MLQMPLVSPEGSRLSNAKRDAVAGVLSMPLLSICRRLTVSSVSRSRKSEAIITQDLSTDIWDGLYQSLKSIYECCTGPLQYICQVGSGGLAGGMVYWENRTRSMALESHLSTSLSQSLSRTPVWQVQNAHPPPPYLISLPISSICPSIHIHLSLLVRRA